MLSLCLLEELKILENVEDEVNNEVVANLAQTVEYSGALTANLSSIEPRYGPVTGGTSITFSGSSFSDDISKYKIIIDGRNCTATAATTTSVTCTADHRPGLIKPSLEIYIDG